MKIPVDLHPTLPPPPLNNSGRAPPPPPEEFLDPPLNSQGHIKVWFGLLGFNASPTARVISRFGLVYWGLPPQQQPGSYRGLVWFIGGYHLSNSQGHIEVWFGLLGVTTSATVRVISRFGLVYWGLPPQQQSGSYRGLVWFIGGYHLSNSQGHIEVWFGLLGLNTSATARVISRFGLVYWGLTPQQQPGSYRGLVWFIGA